MKSVYNKKISLIEHVETCILDEFSMNMSENPTLVKSLIRIISTSLGFHSSDVTLVMCLVNQAYKNKDLLESLDLLNV